MNEPIRHSPRFYKVVVLGLVATIVAVVSLTAFTIGQSRTQHQICQAFSFVGDQTQRSIRLQSDVLTLDIKQGKKQDAKIRRAAISSATSLLIRVRRVQC